MICLNSCTILYCVAVPRSFFSMFARGDPSKNKCAGQDLEWANFDIVV
jgi:hypothetical protein